MYIYRLLRHTHNIEEDDRVIVVLKASKVWKIKCIDGLRKDQETYIDVEVVEDYLEVVDAVEGDVPVGKYTPFSPNTHADVLRLCDQAIDECKHQGLETELGTLTVLRQNIEKYDPPWPKFSPSEVYLDNMEVGETYYCAAVMCLNGSFRTIMNLTDGLHTKKQSAFLDSVCENVANGCTVIQGKSGVGGFFPRGEINAALLCPHFLADPVHTLATIRRGFLGGLDQNHVRTLRQNLEGILNEVPFCATQNAARGRTNKEKAIVWIRRKGGDSEYRDINVARLLQIQEKLHHCGIEEIILFGDSLGPRGKLKDLRPSAKREMTTVAQRISPNIQLKVYDLTNIYEREWFAPLHRENSLSYQIKACEMLVQQFNSLCIICMKSGGPDGASLIGVPQIFFETTRNRYSGMATRIGLTAMCIPAWNQVAIDEANLLKGSGFKDSELRMLYESILNCRRVRRWFLDLLRSGLID